MATKKPAAKAATSTAVAVKATGGAMVDIKAQMAAELATLAGRTAASTGDKIQLKKDGFHLPNGTVVPSDGSIELVVVDFLTAHNFYPGKFDPKNIKPPVCFARGAIPTDLVPDESSPELQADSCGACPRNQFGPNNEAKECKNTRLLAVLPPDATADDPLWILEVSPTALKGFDGFVKTVATKFQVPPIGVVVSVSLDPNVDYVRLVFGEVRPNENVELDWTRRGEAQARLNEMPDVTQYVAAPARGAVKPAPRRK
jgi:hypothetical protein